MTILMCVGIASCSSDDDEIEPTVTMQVSEARDITHYSVTITGSYINNKFSHNYLSFGLVCSPTNTNPTLNDQDKFVVSLFMQDSSNDLEPESGKRDFKIYNLKPNQKYYYRLFFQNESSENEIFYGDVKSFTTAEFKSWGTGSEPGKAIDLGLSVLWADRDLGASAPNSYGGCYRWGEPEESPSFPEGNFLYESYCKDRFEQRENSYYKYWCFKPEYDAATVNWGGKWRMPTADEADELRTKCSVNYDYNNEICEIIGSNGNSIKMLMVPTTIENVFPCKTGYYLTSSYYMYDIVKPIGLGMWWGLLGTILIDTSKGYSIRPVQDK